MSEPTSTSNLAQQESENEDQKTIKTFAAASFLNDMGSDMIYPI
jgi:hypothetical protein